METISTVLILSLLVELTTEIIKSSIPFIRGSRTQFVSIILGLVVCFTTNTGILKVLEIHTSVPVLDFFITGLIISRGSNIVHDLMKKIKTSFV
ncbi:hypothetical protein HYG86_13790 [Alkalicella caledoniensis]|uniref:Uncharacterized protein n=1 Tax=Alkalicella caledoniensis TaxID=2731377 RepID=A0A7G9WAP5_ALKCA|nr:hypothetical protein [Alkalicella caledoniensis]QNO15757.1 hypothetical protein HYG86_13790 [Alkalicella caledoniensis]